MSERREIEDDFKFASSLELCESKWLTELSKNSDRLLELLRTLHDIKPQPLFRNISQTLAAFVAEFLFSDSFISKLNWLRTVSPAFIFRLEDSVKNSISLISSFLGELSESKKRFKECELSWCRFQVSVLVGDCKRFNILRETIISIQRIRTLCGFRLRPFDSFRCSEEQFGTESSETSKIVMLCDSLDFSRKDEILESLYDKETREAIKFHSEGIDQYPRTEFGLEVEVINCDTAFRHFITKDSAEADAVFIVYDCSRRKSFERAIFELTEFRERSTDNFRKPVFVIGLYDFPQTKNQVPKTKPVINSWDALLLAQKHNAFFAKLRTFEFFSIREFFVAAKNFVTKERSFRSKSKPFFDSSWEGLIHQFPLGYIEKRGKINISFQRRFMRIEGPKIVYSADPYSPAKGSIDLLSCAVIKRGDSSKVRCQEVHLRDSCCARDWVLRCHDDDDARDLSEILDHYVRNFWEAA